MELNYTTEKIEFEKELSSIDEFAVDFVAILNRLGLKYVLMSGYVAILFGRNRISEDVDVFLDKISKEEFIKFWREVSLKFECIITHDTEEAYEDYLQNGNAIRFSRKGEFIPNIEIKFPKRDLDIWSLNERKKVLLNGNLLYISPLELQISFKLILGSEKDIEDAKYLYKLFKDKLNRDLLNSFNRKLKVVDKFNKYLR